MENASQRIPFKCIHFSPQPKPTNTVAIPTNDDRRHEGAGEDAAGSMRKRSSNYGIKIPPSAPATRFVSMASAIIAPSDGSPRQHRLSRCLTAPNAGLSMFVANT